MACGAALWLISGDLRCVQSAEPTNLKSCAPATGGLLVAVPKEVRMG